MVLNAIDTVERFHAALMGPDAGRAAADLLAPDVRWSAACPVDDLEGVDAVMERYWAPIRSALPDVERRPFVRVAGRYDGQAMDGDGAAGDWVTSTGYLTGRFVRPLFGIPATGRSLHLRFGEMILVEAGRIAEAIVILDLWDAMVQADVCPLRASLGHPGLVLPPATMDGVNRPPADPGDSATSLTLVREMLDGLGRFDGRSLLSMDQERYWSPDFMWWGPGGIGATRGLDGFRAHHQGPFLKAFPTRAVDRTRCLVADGSYIATGGWPHMTAEHLGGGWLGLAPTGRRLTLRVMDFWRREGDRLRENWVLIDMLDILRQLGLDAFGQMRELAGGASAQSESGGSSS